jgi:hypothetical protein
MKKLFTLVIIVVSASTIFYSCTKEKMELHNEKNIIKEQEMMKKDTPYVIVDTPYLSNNFKEIDTPYLNIKAIDTPYVKP